MKRRVIAIDSLTDGILTIFGEGEYIGDLIPNVEPFISNKIKNPCIKLDSGKYVWGFQCWWGDKEKFYSHYKISETKTIDIGEYEVLPMPEQTDV